MRIINEMLMERKEEVSRENPEGIMKAALLSFHLGV
jgi:hypothetical protein